MTDTARTDYLEYIYLNHNYPPYDWIILTIGILYNWAILIAALVMIARYRRRLQEELSNTRGLDLKILSRQLILFITCWVVITLLSAFSFSRVMVKLSIRLSALFPAVYLLVTYYTFLANLVRSNPLPRRKNPLSGVHDNPGYEEQFQIIGQEMEENRHYLDPDLTLPVLAEKTSFFRNELSEIINSCSGTSFYHFVNSYRIEYFKTLLTETGNSNILELAYESGFNSKSAFYSAFKQITGITPRQYKDGKKTKE